LCWCTGLRNSSSTHLSRAPWLKNATAANAGLAGRKAVCSPSPYPLPGETRSNGLELPRGCGSSDFGKPLAAAGKATLWKALPGKMGHLRHWHYLGTGQLASIETESGTVCPDLGVRDFRW